MSRRTWRKRLRRAWAWCEGAVSGAVSGMARSVGSCTRELVASLVPPLSELIVCSAIKLFPMMVAHEVQALLANLTSCVGQSKLQLGQDRRNSSPSFSRLA